MALEQQIVDSTNPGANDRAELLKSLKIDRGAARPDAGRRPLKWFVFLALVFGGAFAFWFSPFAPDNDGAAGVPVSVVRAQAASAAGSGSSVLDATGYVVARRQATVSAKTTGKVIDVLIEEGDRVEAGQVLAVLDDAIPRAQHDLAKSQLESARAGLEELRVLLRQAELDLDRTRELASRNLASQADLDRDGLTVEGLVARLDRAGKDVLVAERSLDVQSEFLRDMEIRAPFSGVVVAKAAQPGEMISPVSAGGGFTRTGICTIVDMDSLEVEVDVNEAYINRVREDQGVQVTLNAYPQDHYAARVVAIIPTADRNKATVRVRVGFVERDERVLPDMGVRVAFLDPENGSERPEASGVLVPKTAVGRDDAGSYVLLVRENLVRRQTVATGEAAGVNVRVLDGLQGGELLVTDLSSASLAALKDGDRVSVVN